MNPIVTKYVEAALAQLRRLDLDYSPGDLPPAMRDESRSARDDWRPWKAIPSTASGSDISNLERISGLRFPSAYQDFLRYRHFVDLTEKGMRFERHLPGRWQRDLEELYRAYREVIALRLLPFGSESFMDAGPVCFDFRAPTVSDDPPIVFWDHEFAGTKKAIQPMFSGVSAMFRCLTVVAEANDKVPLDQFFAEDPVGAGGMAKDYWMHYTNEEDA